MTGRFSSRADDSGSGNGLRVFPNTRWSVVLAAARPGSPESAAAIEAICRSYWYPLYAYARRSGRSAHDAQDLTQDFFCHLLEKGWLKDANPEKGKLRTFLIVALKHFMAKEWRRFSAQRRGGGRERLQLDTAFAESRYAIDPAALPPEDTFDRQWALILLERTTTRLRDDFTRSGRSADFDVLKSCLLAERGTIDYAGIARQLGVPEGSARVSVHRLRKRFRQIFREEITRTLPDGADVDDEMHHLAAALARK